MSPGPVGSQGAVGFIGLGNMGGRMSRCIVRAGGAVLGYDTNPAVITTAGALLRCRSQRSPEAVM